MERSLPATALGAIVRCTRRDVLTSVGLVAVLAAGTWLSGRTTFLPVAAALLAAWGTAAVCLFMLRRLFPPKANWWWAWLSLLPALLLGAVAALAAYRWGMPGITRPVLTDAQLLASAAAFDALTFGVSLFQAQRQAEALQLAELKHVALQAQLKSLQAQVEPHFLFNTLANTRYLARRAPDQAVRMLDHLIAYLRAALPDLRTASSTLGRECELAQHYLALMAIRFGERLVIDVDCPAELADAHLPPLMLMSLVENAVRHGVEPKPGQVHVRIHAYANAGRLHVQVADDGAGLGQTVLGSGVGLRNLRERLAALYGPEGTFALRTGAEGWTEAELVVPLRRGGHD